jgi:hypothetical protein
MLNIKAIVMMKLKVMVVLKVVVNDEGNGSVHGEG